MTFDDVEKSDHGGAPHEFFHFQMGSTHWRLTSADADRTIAEPADPDPVTELYTAAPITRTEPAFSGEDDTGDITITLPRDHEISQLFRAYTPPRPIMVTVYAQHRSDPDLEVRPLFSGDVASRVLDDAAGLARFACVADGGRLKRMVPGLSFGGRCQLVWGSSGCGIDIELYRESADLTVVSGIELTADVFGTHDDGYWKNGWVERSNGDMRSIVAHVGTSVFLKGQFFDLEAGETVSALPGCEHTFAACRVFNNLVNHIGWPMIPTRNPVSVGVI